MEITNQVKPLIKALHLEGIQELFLQADPLLIDHPLQAELPLLDQLHQANPREGKIDYFYSPLGY